MGGIIALTIRISPEQVYRGSCWTNILPEGLWAAPFYVDLDVSRAHAKTWLETLLARRRADPELEEMWGGHNMLAPLGYGIVIIDYVTSTLVSDQGYSSVDEMYSHGHDPDKEEKWTALEKAGLLIPSKRDYPNHWKAAGIKLPFANVVVGDGDKINETLMNWCISNFGLSDEEVAEWLRYMKEREE